MDNMTIAELEAEKAKVKTALEPLDFDDWDGEEDAAEEEEEEEEGEEGEATDDDEPVEVDGEETTEGGEEDPELTYAKSKGYKGKEAWTGEESDFIGYKAFNKNERLFHKISEQAKELQSTRKAVKELRDGLQNINKTIAEARRTQMESAKTRLSKQRVQSLKDGEFDLAEELDSKLRSIERGMEDEEEEAVVAEEPAFTKDDWDAFHKDWATSNPWFKQNDSLRDAAITQLKLYVYENPDVSPSDAFEKLDTVMTKLIRGTNKKPSSALPASSSGPRQASQSSLKLAPEIRSAIKSMAEALEIPEADLLKTYSKVK